jgi:hypothetical protein
MKEVENFAEKLYSQLLGTSPVRTGNMKSHINLFRVDEDTYILRVSTNVPYAFWVNQKNKGPKQQFNYLWIDRAIQSIAAIVASEIGAEVSDLTGGK